MAMHRDSPFCAHFVPNATSLQLIPAESKRWKVGNSSILWRRSAFRGAAGLGADFTGATGAPPGVRRRKAGTDRSTEVARPRPREYRKAATPKRRGRGVAGGAGAEGPAAPRRT